MKPKQTPSLESLVAQAFNEDWDDETLTAMWEMLGRPGLAHSHSHSLPTGYNAYNVSTLPTNYLLRIRRQLEPGQLTSLEVQRVFHITYGELTKKTIIRPKEKYKYV